MSAAVCVHVQVRLLHDGRERGRMYACYALSSILSTKSGMSEIRAAGVIPALIYVLHSSKVGFTTFGARDSVLLSIEFLADLLLVLVICKVHDTVWTGMYILKVPLP